MPPRVEEAPSPFGIFGNIPVAPPVADKPPHSPDAPSMRKPQLNPSYRLLNLNRQAVQTAEGLIDFNVKEMEEQRLVLEGLRKEQVEKLKEALSKQEDSGFWGVLAKVASMVMGAISTVFGFFLISTGAGTLIGGAMVAAGVLSIANVAMEETGAWDWIAEKLAEEDEEMRRSLRVLLPMGVGVVSSLAGLGGVFASWGAIDLMGKAIGIAQMASNLCVAVSAGAKGIQMAQMHWAEAEHVKIKGEVLAEEERLEDLTRNWQAMMQKVQKENKQALRAVELQVR